MYACPSVSAFMADPFDTVMKFDIEGDLGQGHRSNVKVTRSKHAISRVFCFEGTDTECHDFTSWHHVTSR